MPSEDHFIEHMGQLFERDGMARIAGRIFGRLLLVEEPLNLDGLSEALQVSKASVSTNTRLLESVGLIERLTFPGDRRDYYGVSEVVDQRMLDLRLERFRVTRALFEEGLETDAAQSARIRERLEHFGEFFDRMIEAIASAKEAMAAKRSGGLK